MSLEWLNLVESQIIKLNIPSNPMNFEKACIRNEDVKKEAVIACGSIKMGFDYHWINICVKITRSLWLHHSVNEQEWRDIFAHCLMDG